jgi:hypothetical protein
VTGATHDVAREVEQRAEVMPLTFFEMMTKTWMTILWMVAY